MLVRVPAPGEGAEPDPGHTQAGTAEMPLLHAGEITGQNRCGGLPVDNRTDHHAPGTDPAWDSAPKGHGKPRDQPRTPRTREPPRALPHPAPDPRPRTREPPRVRPPKPAPGGRPAPPRPLPPAPPSR
ncbi:hypothetical protein GCM10017687_68740 [Streptomyces echinatus]